MLTNIMETDSKDMTLGPGGSLENRPRRSCRTKEQEDSLRRFTTDAAQLLSERHCEDVLILDVQGLSDITDYMLLASGTSNRQIKAVGEELEALAEQSNFQRYGREVDGPTSWLVLDFIDVVVHVFEPNTRAHYDLEMLWGDVPRLEWKRQ